MNTIASSRLKNRNNRRDTISVCECNITFFFLIMMCKHDDFLTFKLCMILRNENKNNRFDFRGLLWCLDFQLGDLVKMFALSVLIRSLKELVSLFSNLNLIIWITSRSRLDLTLVNSLFCNEERYLHWVKNSCNVLLWYQKLHC